METEIWVALIGLGGVVYASTVGIFARHVKKMQVSHEQQLEEVADIAAKEARLKDRQIFHDSVTSPYYPVKEWTRFVRRVQSLCSDCEADRVLVLVAVNGDAAPTHASVIWEYRQDGPRFSYIDVPLDQDYVSRLIHIKKGALLRFKTEDAVNTLIGGYYKNEGVTESIWGMVGYRSSFRTEQIAYKYMSVSTHNEGGFTDPLVIEREVANLIAEYRGLLHVSGFTAT